MAGTSTPPLPFPFVALIWWPATPGQRGELAGPPLALLGGGESTKKPLLAVLEGALGE